MAVLDQSYQPWTGTPQPRVHGLLAMVRIGIRLAFAGTITKLAVLTTFAFMFGWVGLLFIFSTLQVPFPIALGNDMYRQYLGGMVPMGILVMMLAALVGSKAVSRDLRFNAVSMYYSKAITRTDYLLGKLAIVGSFLLVSTWIPAVVLWISQWAMARETLTAAQRFSDLAGLTLHSLILVLPITVYVVALSSLSRNAIVPGILWVLTYLGSRGVSDLLQATVKEEWCKLVAWDMVAARLGELCYQLRSVRIPGLDREFKPLAPVMTYGWQEPLAVLGTLTALSLALLAWRLRRIESYE